MTEECFNINNKQKGNINGSFNRKLHEEEYEKPKK